MNTLIVSHLPNGPTATFRLSSVTPRRKLRTRVKSIKSIETGITPHLLTTRFMTRLGRRVERILGALFPAVSRNPVPPGHCRTVVFHNQRDYIFFRHYRYQHRGAGDDERVATNEVGPRFTLKLKSIQKGSFDSKFGDFEWVRKRAEIGKSRRTFVL